MVYLKEQSDYGKYVDKEGVRFEIHESRKVVSPLGINVGWDVFNNIEEAMKAYELEVYYEPVLIPLDEIEENLEGGDLVE